MATNNRAALFAKAHKTLKKYYKPYEPPQRPVLDHLLYACCLENAHQEKADKAFEALKQGLFDWNEVRVSTVRELAETMPMLPNAMEAAGNLRKILFAVFESHYSYDLEGLKKQNLGAAQQRIQKYRGVTPFVLGYVTQATLEGHCVPLDHGALLCLDVLVELTDKEKSSATVSGLERAIPKNKGVEFGSLLHEFGADLSANPYSTNLHKILLEINPDAKDRLPKRSAKKEEPPVAPPPTKSGFDKRALEKAQEKLAHDKAAAEKGKAPAGSAHPAKKAVEPPKPVAGKHPPAAKPAIPAKPSHPAKPTPPSKPVAKKEPVKEPAKKPTSAAKRKPK